MTESVFDQLPITLSLNVVFKRPPLCILKCRWAAAKCPCFQIGDHFHFCWNPFSTSGVATFLFELLTCLLPHPSQISQSNFWYLQLLILHLSATVLVSKSSVLSFSWTLVNMLAAKVLLNKRQRKRLISFSEKKFRQPLCFSFPFWATFLLY